MKTLTASWKTTGLGIVSLAYATYQTYMGPGGVSGAIHDPTIVGTFILGIFGLIAKDGNVTGGTKGQPSSPQALADANQAPATQLIATVQSQKS